MAWYVWTPICLPLVVLVVAMAVVMIRGGDGY